MPNDPATVPGLRVRYKASTISSPPADGGLLSSWTDTAGNSYHATQASSTWQPTYRTSGAFLPNSKPCVEFVAADLESLEAPIPQNTATTRFVVARIKSVPSSAPFTLVSSPLQCSISTGAEFLTAIENVTWLVDAAAASTAISANTWYAFTLSDDGANADKTYINGTIDGNVSVAHSNSGTTMCLGRKAGGGEMLDGYLAEVIEYSTVLSTSDRAIVHSYIQEEYGITVSDYATGPPTPEAGPKANRTQSSFRL